MADYALTGKELKRHIKLARDAPLPFAYNPGGPKGEDYFALHRKRSAEQLGKAAKADGPGAKAAFGSAKVEGKVLELRCEVVVAGMARKLKQHLKSNKVTLNIMVIGPDGSVLEEDIEELADDPDLFDDSPETVAEDTAHFAQQDSEDTVDTDDTTEAKDDPSDVVDGLKKLQPLIASAPGPAADKLKAVTARIVGMIKAGEVEAARTALGQLEAAAAKLAGPAPAPEAPPPPPPVDAPEPAPAPESNDDGRLRSLAERAKALQADITNAQLPEDVQAKLMTAFQNAVGALKARDLDTAETTFDRIAEALTRLGMASDSIRDSKSDKSAKKKDAKEAKSDTDKDDAGNDFDEKAHDLADKIETLRTRMIAQFGLEVQTALGERLDRAVADLEAGTYSSALPAMAFVEESMRLQDAIDALAPDFARAASTGSVEDVDRMRLLFNSAVELVSGPDHAKAWGMLQKVQDMIQDGARRNVNAFLADIPEDARPFAISRLNWTSARTAMKGELDKLRDGIARAVDGQPEYQGIMDNIGSLYAHMDGLDLRLATKLDEVVNADPGAERDTRKAEARNLVREYQSELDKPFFQEVDAANGFAAVAVTATARDALGEIDKVLAA